VQNWIRNIGIEPGSQQKGERNVSEALSNLRMMDQERVETNISFFHTKAFFFFFFSGRYNVEKLPTSKHKL
jgi:hypothetical protein